MALLLLASIATAHATTIDFNEFAGLPHAAPLGSSFTTQGYNFSYDATEISAGTDFIVLQDFNGNTGTSVAPCPWCTVTLSAADNSLFDISTVDILVTEATSTFIGYYSGGGTTQVIFNKPQGSLGWSTFSFDTSWTNLERIEISSPSLAFGNQLDNFVMTTPTAVPIPAAVWLFGSGLGLLGWLQRGRRKYH